MPTRVSLSPRDFALLRLLGRTPATAALLVRASVAFDGGPFSDERRLRERLQALQGADLVRSWPAASAGGGLQNYYKLTPAGFDAAFTSDAPRPPHAFFAAIAPSHFAHTFRLAEVIVAIHRAAHERGVMIERFIRENELTLPVGDDAVQPDAFFGLSVGGRRFHVAIEIDASTESVDSPATNSIRRKLSLYDAYQAQVLTQWAVGGKTWERPRFRVLFLTLSAQRSYHILALAAQLAKQPSRRLIYSAVQAEFLNSPDPLFAPTLLDHRGQWKAVLDLHPTAPFMRPSVRLPEVVESGLPMR